MLFKHFSIYQYSNLGGLIILLYGLDDRRNKRIKNKSFSGGNRQPFCVWLMRMSFGSKIFSDSQATICQHSGVWDNFRVRNIHTASISEK